MPDHRECILFIKMKYLNVYYHKLFLDIPSRRVKRGSDELLRTPMRLPFLRRRRSCTRLFSFHPLHNSFVPIVPLCTILFTSVFALSCDLRAARDVRVALSKAYLPISSYSSRKSRYAYHVYECLLCYF